MKNNTYFLFLIALLLLIYSNSLISQSVPGGFNYQAVIRNSDGSLLKNRLVEIRFSIFNDEETAFVDKYTVNTSDYGLINLIVGKDSDEYNSIDWSKGGYSLKIEINKGSGFEDLGVSIIQSVPFSALAKDVINNDDADPDPLNEIQNLSFNSTTNELSISNGNTIIIPTGSSDADSDPLNEIQKISKSNDSIYLSKDGGFVVDKYKDADADSTNELQKLSILNNELTISNGNTISLPERNNVWTKQDSSIFRKKGQVSIGEGFQSAKLYVNNEDYNYGIYATSNTSSEATIYSSSTKTSGKSSGGHFNSYSSEGIGITGGAYASKGLNYGGFFTSYSSRGIGVFGIGASTTGKNYGVYGTTESDDGYAGYFKGNTNITGELKIGSEPDYSKKGTIRWNEETKDFEGYTGRGWKSLTRAESKVWGSVVANETSSFEAYYDNCDAYGSSVSVGEKYAVVGDYKKGVSTNSAQGKVYIYQNYGASWSWVNDITSSDGSKDDYFGFSVSNDGDYIIVGAPHKKVGDNTLQGKVYIFHRGADHWVEEATLIPPDGAKDDFFGSAVSISGDYAVIAAANKELSYKKQGKVYVYHREGTTWTLQAEITANDGAENDFFGSSISISGEYIVIGAPGKNIEENEKQGKVYIYHLEGDTWVEQANLLAHLGRSKEFFGFSVAIDGNYAIIGSPGMSHPNGSKDAGRAYVFLRIGETWHKTDVIEAYDGAKKDYFGYNVSIKGNYAIVGAYWKDVNGNKEQGKAYIFHRDGGSAWKQHSALIQSDGAENDVFGYCVGISDKSVFVGAPGKKKDGDINGKVYIFSN